MPVHSPTTIESRPGQQPVGVTAASLSVLTSALWGGTPVAISYSVDTLPPVAVAGLRFAMAALFMVLWCRWEGSRLKLEAGQFRPALIAGSLLFLQISLFNAGIQHSNSSHATVLISTFVFWVAGIEHFVTRNTRLDFWKLFGLVIAAAGVVLIFATDGHGTPGSPGGTERRTDTPTLFGDLLLAISGFLLAIKVIYTKYALKVIEPGKLILWHDVVGVVGFAAFSLMFENVAVNDFSSAAVWGLVYQGIFVAGLCFAIQAQLLKHHSASQIAVFSFSTPLFGIVFAVLFRGDPLSSWLLVSGVCVALGIFLVNANLERRRLEPPVEPS